jgi:hypothetical protein
VVRPAANVMVPIKEGNEKQRHLLWQQAERHMLT